MSLFLLWGPLFMTGNGPKIFHFGPKMAKHDRLVNAPKWFKRVHLSVFDHMEPFWAHLDHFGQFQTRIDILLWSTSAKPYFVHSGQKIIIVWNGPKGTRWAPKGSKWSKTPRFTILAPFRPLWNADKPAMLGNFWSKMDHFWAIPSHERSTPG